MVGHKAPGTLYLYANHRVLGNLFLVMSVAGLGEGVELTRITTPPSKDSGPAVLGVAGEEPSRHLR